MITHQHMITSIVTYKKRNKKALTCDYIGYGIESIMNNFKHTGRRENLIKQITTPNTTHQFIMRMSNGLSYIASRL